VVSVLDSDAERPVSNRSVGLIEYGLPLGPIPLINPVFSFYLFLYGTYYSDFTYRLFFIDSADTAGSVNQSVSSCFLSTTLVVQLLNRSINVLFVGRRYTTRPGAPTVVSGKHDQKVHS